MIKAILWDIDGTVLNFLAAENAAIKSCFRIHNLGECTDEMIEQYSKINIKYWEALERGEMTKPEILVGRFREWFGTLGIDTAVSEAFNAEYQIRLGDTICFCDNALETINYFKGKLFQGCVTNGTKVAQTRKLAGSGLDKIFEGIYISEEIGFEKPNVEFFAPVFETLRNLEKDEIMIVGDSLTSDIRGGNNVGIVTCWYNPNHKKNNDGVQVDYEIDDIGQIISIIEGK